MLIDSSGSLTPMNANALVAADDIITPTTVEPFSIRGVELLFKQIEQMKGSTDAIKLIVPTMYDPRSSQALQLLENLQRRYGSRVTQPIRTNVRLSESPSYGKSIFEYDAECRGAEDYRTLVERIMLTLQITPTGDARATLKQRENPSSVVGSRSTANPVVVSGSVYDLQVCPRCGRDMRHTNAAGYRIMICNACNYTKQVLQSGR